MVQYTMFLPVVAVREVLKEGSRWNKFATVCSLFMCHNITCNEPEIWADLYTIHEEWDPILLLQTIWTNDFPFLWFCNRGSWELAKFSYNRTTWRQISTSCVSSFIVAFNKSRLQRMSCMFNQNRNLLCNSHFQVYNIIMYCCYALIMKLNINVIIRSIFPHFSSITSIINLCIASNRYVFWHISRDTSRSNMWWQAKKYHSIISSYLIFFISHYSYFFIIHS